MARQNIFTGTVGNDGTGDDLRTGATKINANFTELYSNITALSLQLNLQSVNSNGIGFGFDGILFDGATKDSMTTVTRLIPADPSGINNITLQDSTGTLAFITDIKKEADRDYILGIRGGTTKLLDSASAIDALFGAGFLDSARANRLSLDSTDVTAYIDSAYIQFRQSGGLDSARALGMTLQTSVQVDSSIDSAVTQFKLDNDIGVNPVDTTLAALTALLTGATTDVTPEDSAGANGGSGPGNLYFTTARANSAIDTRVNKTFVDALNVDADTLDGVQYSTIASAISALPDSAQVTGIVTAINASIPYDLVPDQNEVRDLGTSAKKWKDLHLSGSTIHLGSLRLTDNSGKLSIPGTTFGMDSGQPLSFDSAATRTIKSGSDSKIIVNANQIHMAASSNAAHNGWRVTTNTPAGGAFTDLGNKGLLFVPQNTTTERNNYKNNAFYSSHYRKGAMHYNSVTNGFELADSDGWFSINRSAVSSGAVQYLTFAIDGAVSGASNQDLFTTNGASPPNGMLMPVAGTTTHITANFTSSSYGGSSSTFLLDIDINGVTQTSKSIEVTGNGTQTLNQTAAVSYNAGDRISVALTQDAGHTSTNLHVLLRIQES
jgi:hypothetical protein